MLNDRTGVADNRNPLLVGAALIAVVVLAVLAGCQSPATVRGLSAPGWHGMQLQAGQFQLAALAPVELQRGGNQPLYVYIEGDGRAWLTRHRASPDPTPENPVALHLALAQPAGDAVYLARPCQYEGRRQAVCQPVWWTDRRFSPEVVEALDAALDQLLQRYRRSQLVLIGYSGGASLALLLAQRRPDVVNLVSVAGNLDLQAWTDWHDLTPLHGSLEPALALDGLRQQRQRHLAGAQDKVIPVELSQQALTARQLGDRLQVLDGFDHACCWAEHWPELWRDAAEFRPEAADSEGFAQQ